MTTATRSTTTSSSPLAESAARSWRPRDSARARLLLVQLALVALALLVSLVITRQYLMARVDDRIDATLTQEVDEFRALAQTGIDPVTRAPFDDP